MALHVLTVAFLALHVIARHASFAAFEVVMLATPFVGFVVGTAVVVATVARGRGRTLLAGTGIVLITLGVLLEVDHLIAWSALFADHLNRWSHYQAPPRPCGAGVSVPFLVAGLFAIRHVPDQRWRFHRRRTAFLLVGLALAGLSVLVDGIIADVAIGCDGAVSALPPLAGGLFALAATTALCAIFLSGFVDDRVPCAIVVRWDAR